MESPTVLIVDDDMKFLSFLARILRRGGYAVLTANDGCEVPEMLLRTHIDVLVLDLQMPGMNGWEVIRSLRGEAAQPDIWAHATSCESPGGRGSGSLPARRTIMARAKPQ